MISSVHAVIAGKTYDTGFHVTTPSAFWVQKYMREAADHGDTHMILEVTSHGISQFRVWGIRFALGVITNVTREHLDWHGTFEQYIRSKLSLLKRSAIPIVNRDEEFLYNRAVDLVGRKSLITYGIHKPAVVTSVTHPFTTRLPGEFNRYNCLAALAAAHALGISKRTAGKAIAAFSGLTGRMETVAVKPFRVIVDFAHTPNAIEQVLRSVRETTQRHIIHVFGSAGLRDKGKRPLMGTASARYADVIILTEEDYRTENVHDIIGQIAQGIPKGKKIHAYPDREKAIRYALHIAETGDTVIITGKGHERSLCRGLKEIPWSDQGLVKKILLQE